MRGYKIRADGTKTSFFDTEWDEETKKLYEKRGLGPKALSPKTAARLAAKRRDSPDGKGVAGDGASAWNAEGTTWEDKDVSDWAKQTLEAQLKGAAGMKGLSAGGWTISGSSSAPSKLSCEANVAVIRGRKRYIFEAGFTFAWTAKFCSEDGETSKSVKGKLVYVEVDSDALKEALEDDKPLEVNQIKYSSNPSQSDKSAAREVLSLLEGEIRNAVEAFVRDFRETK
jgi:hypothetical protein